MRNYLQPRLLLMTPEQFQLLLRLTKQIYLRPQKQKQKKSQGNLVFGQHKRSLLRLTTSLVGRKLKNGLSFSRYLSNAREAANLGRDQAPKEGFAYCQLRSQKLCTNCAFFTRDTQWEWRRGRQDKEAKTRITFAKQICLPYCCSAACQLVGHFGHFLPL